MAIKGKRKSQTRGSQARRRPAPAPRVVTARQVRTPWYQTAAGRVAAAVVVVLLLAGIGTVIAQINAAGDRRERRQSELNAYTREISALASDISAPASEMQQVVAQPPGDKAKDLEAFGKQAEGWLGTLTGAVPGPDLRPPSGLPSLTSLFARAVDGYANAATTYGLAARAEKAERAELFTLATQQQQLAQGVWSSAVQILDQARSREGLDPSGIETPGLSFAGVGG